MSSHKTPTSTLTFYLVGEGVLASFISTLWCTQIVMYDLTDNSGCTMTNADLSQQTEWLLCSNKGYISVLKRHTNKCRNFECFCIVNMMNTASMTRRTPQVNMDHFQMRRFALSDRFPIGILLKTTSICLWENTASYRRAALSEMIPIPTNCK